MGGLTTEEKEVNCLVAGAEGLGGERVERRGKRWGVEREADMVRDEMGCLRCEEKWWWWWWWVMMS